MHPSPQDPWSLTPSAHICLHHPPSFGSEALSPPHSDPSQVPSLTATLATHIPPVLPFTPHPTSPCPLLTLTAAPNTQPPHLPLNSLHFPSPPPTTSDCPHPPTPPGPHSHPRPLPVPTPSLTPISSQALGPHCPHHWPPCSGPVYPAHPHACTYSLWPPRTPRRPPARTLPLVVGFL